MNNTKIFLFLILTIFVSGCRQSGFGPQGGVGSNYNPNQQYARNPQNAELSQQLHQLSQRNGRLDSDNQDLQTVVASLQQKLQVSNDLNTQLRGQLKDTADRLKQSVEAQRLAEQRAKQSADASTQYAKFNGATIRANNGLMTKLPDLTSQGIEANMDGDVIRIVIPTENVFVSGTYQISSSAASNFNMIVSAIRRSFSHQIIGVEAHWDGTALQPASISHHQLTATQCLSVFNHLKQGGLPENQMFIMAQGSNRPRFPIGGPQSSQNRRIELVIYPETFDGT